MRRSLVTGGAGFIGSHLAEALLERGDRVRIFDNFSTGRVENLTGLKDRVEIVEGDVRDRAAVEAAMQGVDLVFHHAAFISVPLSIEHPQDCFDANVQGTVHVLEAARAAGVAKVVLASSAAVYGDALEMPISETAQACPNSPYAASKQMNEILAGVYTRAYQLPVVALRYFNVYGPRQSPDSAYAAAIPIFIRNLLDRQPPVVYGDGGQSRDFIFVRDVVSANLTVSESGQADGSIYNICTGRAVDLMDLLGRLEEIIPTGLQPHFEPPRVGDIYQSVGDARCINKELGFRAQTGLLDGLRETVEWMQL
ncbi:MAG: SDR family NAD(P)-dependent oxidoreductase [Anaerolineae bacterium]|nr:SDR family NAD(P)-dependent oxidoreductase [Anaerolineae bacterium]